MLTARTSAEDTLASLEGGANDYMYQEAHRWISCARIRLRLYNATKGVSATLSVAGARAGPTTRRALVEGQSNSGQGIRASGGAACATPIGCSAVAGILSRVCGDKLDPGSNVIDVYVGYLRAKLGAAHIETVRGMGYRLR